MTREVSIARLKRHALLAGTASALVMALGAVFVVLFLRPGLAGVPAPLADDYRGNLLWLALGLIFLLMGAAALFIALFRPGRLLRILRTQPARPMTLRLHVEDDSSSTQYYANLSEPGQRDTSPIWRIALWAPPRGIRVLLRRDLPAAVYLDPSTGVPAVIETADTCLWAMSGNPRRPSRPREHHP